ncbi:MAG TPA: long-chain fatty acid--CoA ligase [Pyrinomonadaceae bacterium]|nr:long-chain fatty acid--CoA ligase [Pyrinomonadaceae bacterium]
MSKLAADISVARPVPVRRPFAPDEPHTLIDVFNRAARVHNRPDALNYKSDGRWISISSDEMLARAKHIAAGLYAIGIRHGDRVALLSDSRVEWTLTDAGCLFASAVDVPIYPTLTPPQVRYILKDSGSSALFLANREKFLEMKEILGECPQVEHVIFFDAEGVTEADGLTLVQLEAKGRELEQRDPGLIDRMAAETTSDDLATIIYTSGTTGEPKGVMLTHENLVSNLIDSCVHLTIGEQDTVLSVLPLSHVFERQAMYMYLHHGMAVYFAESLLTVAPNMREVRPTLLVGVPRMFEKIYQRIRERAAEAGKLTTALLEWSVSVARDYAERADKRQAIPATLRFKHWLAIKLVFSKWHAAFGGRMRLLLSGGAALPEDLARIYIGAGIPIIQGYGLTETSPVVTASSFEDYRVGTVGRAIPHVDIRIAADGEIEVRGPNVMRGYYNKPEETRAAFTDDGWFKTGDIGTIDADGFLRITDRKKELFKTSGGKYIAPSPIEEAIKRSRFVNQVVLVGSERKFPAALIVPVWEQLESYCKLKGIEVQSRSEMCDHPRIIDLLQRQIDGLTPNLARYEKIKKVALLPNEFTIEGGELTPTLKVKRRVIDEKYHDLIEKLYEE